jgi:hypothetical protein
LDPLQSQFPYYTPYQFSGNSPIANVDLDGREDEPYWKHLLKSWLGLGKQPTNSEEAMQRSDEVASVQQVSNNIQKMGEAYETTFSVIPGVSASFDFTKGNTKTGVANLALDIFGEELFKYSGKGLKAILPESKDVIKKAVRDGGKFVAENFEKAVAKAGCFVAGTKVLTNKGYKKIDKIVAGDSVWSYNELSKQRHLQIVESIVIHKINKLIKLIIGDEFIITTTEHPFWINNEWVKAKDIIIGDSVTLFTNKKLRVKGKESKDSIASVYNFTVSNFHTYYVSKLGILVHNDCTELARIINYKGFSKGQLAKHFEKHGAEFGNVTQNVYLKLAKEFVQETGPGIQEKLVGNFFVKYDKVTQRTLITNIKDKEIRTFYKADGRSADAFADAVKLAESLIKK